VADPLDDHLRGHVRRAQTLVARRLADARSHAAAGSLEAATSRIDELGEGLVLALADARKQFYRRAFHHHRDPAIHDLNAARTADDETVAATAAIGGRDQYTDLATPLAEAIAHLRTAAVAAEQQGPNPGIRHQFLAGWEGRHRAALSRHIETALSDAQRAIHTAVGVAVTREDLR
jgi:hypothetical protein